LNIIVTNQAELLAMAFERGDQLKRVVKRWPTLSHRWFNGVEREGGSSE